jgi:hypothetical protein
MSKPRGLHRNLIFAASASFLLGASSIQCGGTNANNTSSGFAGSGTGAGSGVSNGGASANGGSTGSLGLGGGIGIDVQTMDYSAEQIYANDPPITACDGGGMPPPVTGTPECPSDKNLPGCPCPAGATSPCWTGLRVDRGQGDCKDGMTTCGVGEQLVWGPCQGEVLPMGTTGKAACKCFSSGHWAIANLSPCFYSETDDMGNTTSGAISTLSSTGQCPSSFTAAPTESWSTDTIETDCAGTFSLCYTIKAGNGKAPLPTDCTIAKVCASAYYMTAGMVQQWPDLPGWISDPSASACVTQFQASGGYGQMSVVGQSNQCEDVSEVFQTVTYCPTACNGSDAGMCGSCQAGGGGTF